MYKCVTATVVPLPVNCVCACECACVKLKERETLHSHTPGLYMRNGGGIVEFQFMNYNQIQRRGICSGLTALPGNTHSMRTGTGLRSKEPEAGAPADGPAICRDCDLTNWPNWRMWQVAEHRFSRPS